MTADLSALIARLEAAEVGSRELDWDVGAALFTGVRGCAAPNVTTSLDAALSLAERLFPRHAKTMTGNAASGFVAFLIPRGGQPIGAKKTFAHPAIAMSAAILRAKQGEGE